MSVKRKVELTPRQRERCLGMVNSGTAHARSIMHAHVLLKADSGPDGPGWTDGAISDAFGVSTVTVANIRRTMVQEGLDAALRHYDSSQREYHAKLDGRQEAHLIAIARSDPPAGFARWSLRMIGKQMVLAGHVDSLSHVTVGKVLKKGHCSPGVADTGVSRLPTTRSS
jgi:Homeodomain-like domain